MTTPVLSGLWAAFPDHATDPPLFALYTHLGGTSACNINAPGFGANGNTCASRLSVAFNGGGAPISRATAQAAGAQTISAADGSQIIVRVTEFRTDLLKLLGRPQVNDASTYDSQSRGRRGIIAFTVNRSDASGHIALWNGTGYREAHDDYATYASGKVRTSRGEYWALT